MAFNFDKFRQDYGISDEDDKIERIKEMIKEAKSPKKANNNASPTAIQNESKSTLKYNSPLLNTKNAIQWTSNNINRKQYEKNKTNQQIQNGQFSTKDLKGKDLVKNYKEINNNTPEKKQNLGSDLAKIYENFGSGMISGSASTIKTPIDILNPYAQKLGINQLNDLSQGLSQVINRYNYGQQRATNQISNPALKVASQASGAIGGMVPSITAAVATGGGSLLPSVIGGLNAAGQYMTQAEEQGANQTQKLLYGTLLGTAEGLTDKLTFGQLGKGVSSIAKGTVGKGIANLGISGLENATQEAVMEPIQEATNQAILGKSDWSNMGQRMLQSGMNGALVSIILGGASFGLGKSLQIKNKMSNGEKVTQSEINSALDEINKSKNVDQVKSIAQEIYSLNYSQTNSENSSNTYADTSNNSMLKNLSERLQKPNLSTDNQIKNNTSKINTDEIKSIYDGNNPNIEQNKDNITKNSIVNSQGLQLPNATNNVSNNSINGENINNFSKNNTSEQNNTPLQNLLNHKQIEESNQANLVENQQKSRENLTDLMNNSKGKSSFAENIKTTENLSDNAKKELLSQPEIKYYDKITNADTEAKAKLKLEKGGQDEINRWHSIESKHATAEDIAEGIQLMIDYDNKGEYDNMNQVGRKLREMGTASGQTVQAFSILQRLTPEGMVKYAQGTLDDARKELVKANKTPEWIKKHVGDLTLTSDETKKIVDNMKQVQTTKNARQKDVLLGEINKIVADKLPVKAADSIKAFRRIAMLLNTKTMNRNFQANAMMVPVNHIGDSTIGTLTDKMIAKKTGVRTIGVTNPKTYVKGFGQGAYESFDDWRRGINTRDMNGNKFEIARGNSFKNKGLGKALNRLDTLTNFTLDIGDRPFFKAEYMNEYENLKKLNKGKMSETDMVNMATKVAEERTYQDNNNYTKATLGIRNAFNKINIGGVGAGDIVMPFVKTLANITKAIENYSPAGVLNAIVDGNNLKQALKSGNYTPELQRKVASDISKAFMGSMVYVIGYALAKAGIISGKADKDKDVASFKKNVLGINPYSIKIDGKSFTYDWAQPLAAPLGIMANVVQNKENGSVLDGVLNAMVESGNMLYDQSFLQGIKKLFNQDSFFEGVANTLQSVPASFVPTFIKQLNDLYDNTQRNTYDYTSKIKTSLNQVIAKIPGLSKTLPAQKDVLGRDIKKYNGENSIFNVFLNPANVNKDISTAGAKEALKVYNATGDKSVIPKLSPNYFEYKGDKYTLNNQEVSKWQEKEGKETNSILESLAKDKDYKSLLPEEKAKVIKDMIGDNTAVQKQEYLKTKDVDYDLDTSLKDAKEAISNGLSPSSYYVYRDTIANLKGVKDDEGNTISGSAMAKKAQSIVDMNISDTQKNMLLQLEQNTSKNPVKYDDIKDLNQNSYQTYFGLNTSQRNEYATLKKLNVPEGVLNEYYKNISSLKGIKDDDGNTISGSKKKAIFNYINSLDASKGQKILLFVATGYDKNKYKNSLFKYINSLDITKKEKEDMWESLGY